MKSITFNAYMTRAILDGRKTQTRRIGKHGEVGDVLWVKKGICLCDKTKIPTERYSNYWYGNETLRILYAADGPVDNLRNSHGEPMKFDSPIFMERRMARLFIRITAVRQERLQEISEDDAIREGATGDIPNIETIYPKTHFAHLWDSINGDKTGLAWADNPLVWVHEFDVADALKLEGAAQGHWKRPGAKGGSIGMGDIE